MKIGFLGFCIILFSCCSVSYASTAADLNSQTQKLITLSDSPSRAITRDVIEAAKIRNEFMKTEISHSSLFIKSLLPTKITKKLPDELQPYLEKEVSNVEGKLEILAALVLNNQKEEPIQYRLVKGNQIFYLHFTNKPTLNLKTDDIINIKRAFQIPTSTQINDLVVDPNDIVIVKEANAMPLSFGPQKTIAMLVNFRDNPANKPWTAAQISQVLFNTINNVYYESSFKQTTVVGQTVGYYTLNLDSTTDCNTLVNQIPVLADQAATSAGIDLSQYPRRMYIFPRTNSCGWAGLGYVGGAVTISWINGYGTSVRVTGHELGHNIGLYHSRSIACPSSPNEGTCTLSEYGDNADIMGGGNSAHFNALQKDRLGWLNYQISPPITTVTTSGNYFIDVYEAQNNKPKALKIRKSATSSDYYYLEFRQGIGYDAELANCGTACDYTKGIVFHQGSPTLGNTDLLDMTPGGTPSMVSLYPCKTWTTGNITFAVQSISTKGAKVSVTYGPESNACHHVTPTISYPTITPFTKAGEKVLYTINITNNDSGKCKALDFVITPQNQSPLIKTTLNKNSLRIEPGKTQQVNLEVIPQKLPSGIYPIGLMVKNGIDDKYSASTNLMLGINQ